VHPAGCGISSESIKKGTVPAVAALPVTQRNGSLLSASRLPCQRHRDRCLRLAAVRAPFSGRMSYRVTRYGVSP